MLCQRRCDDGGAKSTTRSRADVPSFSLVSPTLFRLTPLSLPLARSSFWCLFVCLCLRVCACGFVCVCLCVSGFFDRISVWHARVIQ